MTTFDDILPEIGKILAQEELATLRPIIINRDLNGRVRLILNESTWTAINENAQKKLVKEVRACLGRHKYAPDRLLLSESDFEAVKQYLMLFETDLKAVKEGAPHFLLEDFLPEDFKNLKNLKEVTVVDRLVTETDWSNIEEPVSDPPRMVFFSIKGGVGRSTALAATAWCLAQLGKRVLVLDLDLESPGLSSSLLPDERRPTFGITDWLVEDLVDNGDAVFGEMFATSDLSHDGEIYVVPAHGRDPGEYIVKLGRAWMPKIDDKGVHEPWSARLRRLLDKLAAEHKPDVVLIDSRAGIDEVAAACVTELGANDVFLFALDTEQTWTGYKILFEHWNRMGVTEKIRDLLHIVGAMIPVKATDEDIDSILEKSWNLFTEQLYESVPAGELEIEGSFDQYNEDAPHYPLIIRWNSELSSINSVYSYLKNNDELSIDPVFGRLLYKIFDILS